MSSIPTHRSSPLVLTVGDADVASSLGPTTDRRIEPDAILADSRAFFTDGDVSAGSSNAAPCVAGVDYRHRKPPLPPLRPCHLLRIAQAGPIVPATTPSGAARRPQAPLARPPLLRLDPPPEPSSQSWSEPDASLNTEELLDQSPIAPPPGFRCVTTYP